MYASANQGNRPRKATQYYCHTCSICSFIFRIDEKNKKNRLICTDYRNLYKSRNVAELKRPKKED